MNTARMVTIATTTALLVPTAMVIATGNTDLPLRVTSEAISQLTLKDISDDVWSYPGRSLNSIDSLFFGTWNYSTQVLGDYTVADVRNSPAEQPVIESVADSVPDLSTKLDSTVGVLSQLGLNYQKITGEVGLMALKWNNLQKSEVTLSLDELVLALESEDQLTWLSKAWGWPQLSTIASLASQAKHSLTNVQEIVSATGTQPVAYLQLKSALRDLESIQQLIGESGDTAKAQTLYGQNKRTQELAAAWNGQRAELTDLLAQAGGIPVSQLQTRVAEATTSVLALNRIPLGAELLAKEPRSKILDLIELAGANQVLLAQENDRPVVRTWLAENPLVVRTLVVNPSTSIRQQVAIKYYLPYEIVEKDIQSRDPDLEVKYDSEAKKYYVTGNLAMAAADSKILQLEITDLWQLDQAKIDDLRRQATEKDFSFDGTPLFASSVTLKSAIDSSLNRISVLQSQITTPQQRITAFRQITVEQASVTQNLAKLEKLSSQAGSAGSLLNSLAGGELLIVGLLVIIAGMTLFFLASGQHPAPTRQFRTFTESIASSDL
ncbi:MAG: hypothetical protein Q7S31_02475 [bacterium]|nr:hypothetical protein [bacterium]